MIWIPNGLPSASKSLSRVTRWVARAAKAHARKGSSLESRLRCLPSGDGSTQMALSRSQARAPALLQAGNRG